MKSKRLIPTLLLLLASLSISAQLQTDIANVINSFVSGNSSGGVGWDFFKDNPSMKRYDNNLVEGNEFPYMLRFSSILTMNRKAVFKSEIGDDGSWGLALYGARAGAFVLHIETFFIYTDPIDILNYLKSKLILTQVRANNQTYGGYDAIYKVKGSYMRFVYSMGATGCGPLDIYVAKSLNDINAFKTY